MNSPLSYLLPAARCENTLRAYRQTAKSLTEWGWVFGINFADAPRDLSGFRGVSFWVRREATSGKTMFLSVVDWERDPVGQLCILKTEDSEKRCDPNGIGFGIEEEWSLIRVDLAELKQRAFGAPGLGCAPEAVMGLSFAADRGDWDIQIDDIGF